MNKQILPLLNVSLRVSFLIGIFVFGLCVIFPYFVFGLLTNHTEIVKSIQPYIPWLLIILCSFSIAWILEGYYSGLTQGNLLRNVALISTFLGFAPIAIWTWLIHSNHLLWLALTMFMVTRVILLGLQLPANFDHYYSTIEADDTKRE